MVIFRTLPALLRLMSRFSVRLLLLSVILLQSHAMAAERFNIVFCFADDWGRYASAYANLDGRPNPSQVIKTPNMDRVAREGVLFRNAFVNAPSCTPCRSSLLSGRHFFNTERGAILQGAVWNEQIPSWPLLLKDHGYHIGETWKVWGPGTPNDAPYGAGKYAYEKAGSKFNNFSENVTALVKAGTALEEAKAQMYADVRGNFETFLADRKDGQPFCYWFGPTNTHRTWVKGSGKALWQIEPDDLKNKLPKFLPDVPEVREDFADYLGEAQAYDAGIGVLLKKLEEIGELDKTVIVISGDHGAPGFPGGKCNLYDFGFGVGLIARWPDGKGGRVVDDFVSLPDLCPTFLEVGGVKAPDHLYGRSLVKALTSDKSGIIDETRTAAIAGRERHVAGARAGNLTYPQRAYRTRDFLYIRNFKPERTPMGDAYAVTETSEPSQEELETNTFVAFPDMDASPTKAWLVAHRNDSQWKWIYDYAFAPRPEEELYDLKKDPDQIINLASKPEYAATRQQLAEQLMKELTDAGDPRVTGDGETFERSPFTDAVANPKKGKAATRE